MWPGQQPPGGEQNPQNNPYQQPPGGGGNPQSNPYQQPPGGGGDQQNNPYQQPPGGEQNPQNNPYQQPPGAGGTQQNNPYQQPNPHQQPGYQQPNPYQQPGYQQTGPYAQQQPWGGAVPAATPQPGPGGSGSGGAGRNRTKLVAIVAAAAVVVAAGVTGFLVLGGGTSDDAKGGGSASPTVQASPSATDSEDNPRGTETLEPEISGWKVVVNPKWGVAYDVPQDWEVLSPGISIYVEDEDGKPLQVMGGAAQYKSKWCTSDDDKDGYTDDTSLGTTGVKGGRGAKNTDEVAINTAGWWVYGAFTKPDKKSLQLPDEAEPYTTTSGVQGSIAWASSKDNPNKGKCATDGQAVSFGFKNSAGDFVAFSFYGPTGVEGAVSKETVMKILSSVRLHGTPTSD